MTWTTPADLRAQVQKLWDRGVLPGAVCGDEVDFPLRLKLKGPTSKELSDRFSQVQEWISDLTRGVGRYRIEWRTINHRVLGINDIPSKIWIDSLEDGLELIGKRQAAQTMSALVERTREARPELLPWLAKRPLRALELAGDWPRLLAVVHWVRNHPRPGISLRQIDLPGVHTKFIEGHRGVLGELLDLVLPEEAIEPQAKGITGFCRRYGFRDKPLRVRFRMLDPTQALLLTDTDQDITVTKETFAELDLPVSTIFITENEINFLSFPPCPGAMVIFGAGYGFDNLAEARWLGKRNIRYWGDIDTHGFAILNQFRGYFPKSTSFLMDRETLLAHRELWGIESRPESADLPRLNSDENALYHELRENRWGERVRLEQERIGFEFLKLALAEQS